MNAYIKWTNSDIEGLANDGLWVVLTEVDACGKVIREIGMDEAGRVVYKWPSSNVPKRFSRGLFDEAVIEHKADGSQMTLSEFDELWQQGEFTL